MNITYLRIKININGKLEITEIDFRVIRNFMTKE